MHGWMDGWMDEFVGASWVKETLMGGDLHTRYLR
jgi:hypothetical protein